jgi:alpha-maltose-1-phosphate synthase
MKIRFVVEGADHGYSFIIQAKALEQGLKGLGVETSFDDKIKISEADAVIGVGSFIDFDILVDKPRSEGAKRVVPWMVSDDRITKFVAELSCMKIILTPSEFSKSIMVRDGINENIIQVLPEAVDSSFWKPITEKEMFSIMDLLSISDGLPESPIRFDLRKLKKAGIPVLFTTGGDVSSKGALQVIAALGNIYKRTGNKNWVYLLKTWPSAHSMQKSLGELELCKNLGILENIKYIVGEYSFKFIRAMMNYCDIYAAPSRSEGFGLPLVEASMCAKPVITCEGTAACESVVHEKTGFIAKSVFGEGEQPRAKVQEIEKYLELLMADEVIRQKMGNEGQKTAVARYAPEVIARKLMELI